MPARTVPTWRTNAGPSGRRGCASSRRRAARTASGPASREKRSGWPSDLEPPQWPSCCRSPRAAADGASLAWSGPRLSADPTRNGIWAVEPGRGPPRRLVQDGYAPAWSADGRALYLSRFVGPDAGLWRFDLGSGAEVRLRAWSRVPFFDIVAGRLVFTPERGRSQIYAMSLSP